MRALLDVNVLIALLDSGHLHHRSATAWLSRHVRQGWASCPLTQNGCMRIMSSSSYANPQSVGVMAARLTEATNDASHEFWPDVVSLLDEGVVRWQRVLGSRQLTDVYLLALAVARNACFVTFDHGIPVDSVDGAQARHVVALA